LSATLAGAGAANVHDPASWLLKSMIASGH